MPLTKGAVERVSQKTVNTKYGERFGIGIVVDGEWYNFLSQETPNSLGLVEGASVAFQYRDNEYGHQLDGKSLEVAKGQGRTTRAAPARSGVVSGVAGAACGHAITNAVQLAIADGDTSTKNIYSKAVDILAVATHLQSRYDKIVEAAKKGEQEKLKPDVEEDEAEEVVEKPKKKAPAKKAKPEPEPEPEPEEDEQGEIDFDDDCPF